MPCCPPTAAIKQRFRDSWSRKRSEKSDDGDERGPDGLRLLHASAQPLVDLVFVHGLRGGSTKTWRKGTDAEKFWPECWLPSEPGLRNVNIYTFGYDSDWASPDSSILDVHAFGRNLLGGMKNSPHFGGDGGRPIIMVGHSMGGLVIKKAFLLAREVPQFKTRMRSIFFLATPHRGSDFAAMLNRILAITGILSRRRYINDLTTGLVSIQGLNEEFEKHAHELAIFSFFEGLRTRIGISYALVVDEASAVLGYDNEEVQYINANHRDICKYESPNDPNYVIVKDALVMAVTNLLKDETLQQLRVLRDFLGISDTPHETYQKAEGSCQWIDARDDFCVWREGHGKEKIPEGTPTVGETVSVFWVYANPGTGKTVLASHVVSHLQGLQRECAYHYFHAGDSSSQSLEACLKSIAYQMAVSNRNIRNKLCELVKDGETRPDMDGSRVLWTKVFRKCIFQAPLDAPQYWVIDALDECGKYQELFSFMAGDRPSFPLRIFLTSRLVGDMKQLQQTLEPQSSMACIQIPAEASVFDIQRYIGTRAKHLKVDVDIERQQLADAILDKANGCFLWVRLVLDTLEESYSHDNMIEALESMPEGMSSYYERTASTMSTLGRNKDLAKAILLWTTMSTRRLTVDELTHALKLDINAALPSAKSAVEGLCGQLVVIDRDSGLISLVHPTAREFLLSEAAGEFTVSESAAHERIALACLQLLCSNEMRPPRHKRLLGLPRPAASPFLGYALTHFSEHIACAPLETSKLLAAMEQFFKTNVLSWVERLSERGGLHPLLRASKNLASYLDSRAKSPASLSSQVGDIEGWPTDLSQLVTRFGDALLHNPASIHFLIPPLCPSGSVTYRHFGKRHGGLEVIGYKSNSWDDCIANVSFGARARAVSCGENLIAVAVGAAEVQLYHHRSFQKQAVVRHASPVYLVHLVDNGLVACTSKYLIFQDLEGNTVWQHRLRFRCMYLSSSGPYLIGVLNDGRLLKWETLSGTLIQDELIELRDRDINPQPHNRRLESRVPDVVSVSPDAGLLALGYRGGTVCIWETSKPEFLGWAKDKLDRQAAELLFNPNPDLGLLAAIYTDHTLALFDSWSGSLTQHRTMPHDSGVFSAACSPDGRTIVTLDTRYNMRVWDFESLSLLYEGYSDGPGRRLLSFTTDGSNIIDVANSGMRIWSLLQGPMTPMPAVTARSETSPMTVTKGEYESRKAADVTMLCPHPSLPIVIAGKNNGQVIIFDAEDGSYNVLYSHQKTLSVTHVAVIGDLMALGDDSNMVQVWSVAAELTELKRLRFEFPAKGQVFQLCFSLNGEYLLVATAEMDSVYRSRDGICIGSLSFKHPERRLWKWFIPASQGHGRSAKQHFSLLVDGVIWTYDAEHFPQRATESIQGAYIQLAISHGSAVLAYEAVEVAVGNAGRSVLAVEVRHSSGITSASTTLVYDLGCVAVPTPTQGSSEPAASCSPIELTPLNLAFSNRCKHFIGFSQESPIGKANLVFIDQFCWLSTVDLSGVLAPRDDQKALYAQHFFVPNTYRPRYLQARPTKTADDEGIVFCVNGELVCIRNGMTFLEMKELG